MQRSLGSAVDAQEAVGGLRTRRQWEGRRAVSIGLGRRLGQLLVGSRALLGLRCCASDRGEGRLSWWRGAGISESRPRGWLGRGRGFPGQVHGGWHALGSCGLLSSDLGGGPRKLTERYVKSGVVGCCRIIFRLQCRKAGVVFRGELTNHPARYYCVRLRRRRGGGATMKNTTN